MKLFDVKFMRSVRCRMRLSAQGPEEARALFETGRYDEGDVFTTDIDSEELEYIDQLEEEYEPDDAE